MPVHLVPLAGQSVCMESGRSLKNGLIQQWGGKTTLFFAVIHATHDLTTGLLVALLPFIRQDLGLNYLQSGLLASAFSITAGLSQILGGWASDRLGRQRIMAAGLLGVGVCTVAIGLTSAYYVILALLIVQGVMAGAYHPSAISTLTARFETTRRGRAIALHMLGGSIGFLVGPSLGAPIAGALSWHYTFLLLGIPAVIASLIVATQPKLTAAPAQGNSQSLLDAASKGSLSEVVRVFRSMASIVTLVVAVQLLIGPIMAFMALFLVDQHHLSTEAAAIWVSVIRFGGLGGSIFGGWLSDRWGRQRAVLLALVLLGPTLFLIASLPFNAGLIVVLLLFGWLMSMRETTMQTYLMDNTPAQVRAMVFGIYFGFGQEGSSLIQPVIGHSMDIIGIHGVFNVIAFVGIGVSLLTIVIARRAIAKGLSPKRIFGHTGTPDRKT
jgi:FSR family fosmidomycin resistance protein-like MFS transporter